MWHCDYVVAYYNMLLLYFIVIVLFTHSYYCELTKTDFIIYFYIKLLLMLHFGNFLYANSILKIVTWLLLYKLFSYFSSNLIII